MATYYVDPEGGLDTNNGTTFALRKKTLTSAATVSTAGDTIRVIQSPNPTSIGTCTWTKDSGTVTIPAGLVVNVENCESAWIASSNVTLTYVAGKEGTNCMNVAIAAGFTTGKVVYKQVNSGNGLDVLTMQQLSLWLRQTAGTLTSVGDLTINLCNDSSGTSPVPNGTFSFPTQNITALNQWMAMTVQGTGAIGGINSIAIYRNVNRSAQTFQFDNIIACKAKSAADSISLTSLISKGGSDAWAPIRSIQGTTLILDGAPTLLATDTTIKYSGVTETVTTYKRETIKIPQMGSGASDSAGSFATLTAGAGTVNNRKYWSGGWNSTDMSTKVGETYLDGINGYGWLLQVSAGYQTLDDINMVRAGAAFMVQGAGTVINANSLCGNLAQAFYCLGLTNATINAANIAYNGGGTFTGVGYSSGGATGNTFNLPNVSSNSGTAALSPMVNITGGVAGYQYRETYNLGTLTNNSLGGLFIGSLVDSTYTVASIVGAGTPIVLGSTSASAGTVGSPPHNVNVRVTGEVTCPTGDAVRVYACSDSTIDLTGATVSTSGALNAFLLTHSSDVRVLGGTISSGRVKYDMTDSLFIGTTFSTVPPQPYDTSSVNARVTVQSYNGVAGDNRMYTPYATTSTSTAQRHTASGYSWNIINQSPLSSLATLPGFWNELPLAQVAVGAGTLVTASIWVYRDSANATARLTVKGNQIAGVPADVVAIASGPLNAWEQLTVTFTPTATGVVQFTGQHAAATTAYANAWFDDFDVSQA